MFWSPGRRLSYPRGMSDVTASELPLPQTKHRTEPDHETKGWPRGVPYIIGNEGCERFSFYGMKAILYVYLTYLLQEAGMVQSLAEKQATSVVHTFVAGVYALPLVGAIIADRLLGKYNTIIWLSLVYCAGHACLAAFEGDFNGFALGLILISVGSGGIKPCVSAHVGDQFGRGNWHRLKAVYGAFYFIINFGSMFSTLLIPWVKETLGWSVAFAIPGVLMAIATVFFWMGRNVFVHVPASPGGKLGLIDACVGVLLFLAVAFPMFGASVSPAYAGLGLGLEAAISAALIIAGLLLFSWRQKLERDDGFLAVMIHSLHSTLRRVLGGPMEAPTGDSSNQASDTDRASLHPQDARLLDHWLWGPAARHFGPEAASGPVAVLRICSVFAMVSVFWALFDQYASSWVEQARAMDRTFSILGWEFSILPSQVSAINPLLVMLLVPSMARWGYPMLEQILKIEMTPLTRMTIGMFVAAASFVVVALLQHRLDDGHSVHVAWQFLAFLIITVAEVMVSVTGLEFAYTQAPKRMKSLIMGLWLFTVALGNKLVALLAQFQGLPWAAFFWTFAGLMAVAAILFGIRARYYPYRSYTQ